MEKSLRAAVRNSRFAFEPRETQGFAFSRLQRGPNISRLFADFHCDTGIYLGAFGFPCTSIKVTHNLLGPQARDRRTRFP